MDVAVDKFIKGCVTGSRALSDIQTESVKELVTIVVRRAVHVSCSVD